MTVIINSDQTGFIRGRIFSNNIRRLISIIYHLDYCKIPSAIVAMDAEKAFDRIERKYVIDVLQRFGFQSDFIHWIEIIYKMPIASV